MRTLSRTGWCAAASLVAATVAGVVLLRPDDRLMGEDLAAVRREALSLFPRGSRVAEAERRLAAMRFRCIPVEHKVANITSASLACDSNGRSFPASPGFNLTVVGRWGLIADIEVWNTFGDAQTPTSRTASR